MGYTEIERLDMEKEENRKYWEGMCHQCWGYKVGDKVFTLGYYQIFNHFYVRVRTVEGESLSTGQIRVSDFPDAFEEFGKIIAMETGTDLSPVFTGPKREREEAERKRLEMAKKLEVLKPETVEFEKRFYGAHTDEIGLMDSHNEVALIPIDSEWLKDKLVPDPEKIKVTPVTRAKFKGFRNYVVIRSNVYDGDRIYNALFITKGTVELHAKDDYPLIIKNDILAVAIAPTNLHADIILEAKHYRTLLFGEDKQNEVRQVQTRLYQRIKTELLEKIEKLKAKEKPSYYDTVDQWVNNEIGHSGLTESYLKLKQRLGDLPEGYVYDIYTKDRFYENGELVI